MGLFGFGQFRTVKVKIPRKCEWCEARLQGVVSDLVTLREMVDRIEANSTADHSMQLIRMKLETGARIFSELVKGQPPVTITPAQLDAMLGLYTDIIEANDRIICGLQSAAGRGDPNRPPTPSKSLSSPTSGTNGHSSQAVPSKA